MRVVDDEVLALWVEAHDERPRESRKAAQSISGNGSSWPDQEKLSLYENSADYAKEHNLALGQALSVDQVKALDAPMLWYVEQAVPDPRCTLASSICPSVNALVPQVYLPEGYAQALAVPTGGTISGENIKLTVDGQLRNTGQVVARDTLTVKAESIDLSPNVVSIGTNAYKAQGGWNVVTGTVVQPGGFLSAMHMDIEADSIRAINDAFRVTRADGTVDAEASAALVAQLKESLGLNYTEGTVADDIHTQFIKEKKGFGILGQILAMAAAVAVSIVTAGSAAAAMGVALAKMTLGEAILVAALSSMAGSMASQIVSGQGLNFGKIAQAGLIGAVTAGLTNGITFDGSSFGLSEWGQSLEGTRTLANLAGSNTAGGVLQAAKDGATGTIYQQAIGMVGTGLINAGINTAFNGGSFGQAFLNNLVAQTAALGANAIGNSTDPLTLQNVAAHAALGCAAQSAMGDDCGSGAIGGATSAVVAPLVGMGLGIETNADRADPMNRALVTAVAMLAGGGLAAALGGDATAAAGAAQNEALNNYLSGKQEKGLVDSLKSCAAGDTQCVAKWTSYYASVNTTQQQAAQNCTLDNCTAIANDARAPSINSSENRAACQGVATCESLLSSLSAQNVSAQASALSRWNSTSNEKAQDISQQAAQGSTGSSIWAQMFGQLSPVDASGMVDAAIGAMMSRGVATNGAPYTPLVDGGGLQVYEDAGGHLIARHVGMSDADLANRLATSNVSAASTFADRATAETAVFSAIKSNQSAIRNYLSGNSSGYLAIEYTSPTPVGTSLSRGATNSTPASNVRVVIARDPTMSTGYRIITGYPH